MSSPNILLILVDQHRYDCVGANGHPLVQTPHLDRMAHEGVNFSHAFTPIAVCCPARASLITGLWPVQHGVLFTEMAEAYRPMRTGLPVFPRGLRDAGYYVACAGKWHAGTEGGPLEHGFDEYIPESGYARWREAQGLPPLPRRNGFFGETDPAISAGQSRLAWTAGQTLTLLQKARDRGQPFFIMWSPSEPHLPNVVPEPYASLYPPAQVPPWLSFSDPLAGKPYIQRQQRVNWGVEGWTWEHWAPTVARYLGEITLLDAQVGRLLAELDALGLADDTMVIYTSDHGDLCGGHGMVDKHYVMYDDVMRVPFIVRWPRLSADGAADAGGTCDAFVTTGPDLARTFCGLAGVSAPAAMAGQDLVPLLRGAPGDREYAFGCYFGNQFGMYSQRMVRDRGWKYIWNPTAEDELYDLRADPGELHNLIASPAAAGELARLRTQLAAWLRQVPDPLYNAFTRGQLDQGEKL